MKSDARWMTKLTGRVLVNAFVGGLAFAFVGALCGGTIGALTGFIHDRILGYGHSYLRIYIEGGIMVGILSGIFGSLICGIFAFYESPNLQIRGLIPLVSRIAFGQILGTFCTTTAFFAYELAKHQLVGGRFIFILVQDESIILLGAPALMICGAIAGALWKSDKQKGELTL